MPTKHSRMCRKWIQGVDTPTIFSQMAGARRKFTTGSQTTLYVSETLSRTHQEPLTNLFSTGITETGANTSIRVHTPMHAHELARLNVRTRRTHTHTHAHTPSLKFPWTPALPAYKRENSFYQFTTEQTLHTENHKHFTTCHVTRIDRLA